MALKASLDDGKAELKGGIEVPFFQHRRGDPGRSSSLKRVSQRSN
jgi:hypothetical protein